LLLQRISNRSIQILLMQTYTRCVMKLMPLCDHRKREVLFVLFWTLVLFRFFILLVVPCIRQSFIKIYNMIFILFCISLVSSGSYSLLSMVSLLQIYMFNVIVVGWCCCCWSHRRSNHWICSRPQGLSNTVFSTHEQFFTKTL
jgi:hypothetical protein